MPEAIHADAAPCMSRAKTVNRLIQKRRCFMSVRLSGYGLVPSSLTQNGSEMRSPFRLLPQCRPPPAG